jgi:hypothetical protein
MLLLEKLSSSEFQVSRLRTPSPQVPSSSPSRLKPKTPNPKLETTYLLARRGRNERVNVARGATARANGLLATSFLLPPNAGRTTLETVCPVSRSIARMDNSSTGVTIVIARPVLPALPVRPMRCT